jgi:hypothetical protein
MAKAYFGFVFVRSGKILLVLALVAMLGVHWAALQTVAWTTMLADNLQSGSFQAAVKKTFDGQHPCCLCKAIAAAKKSGQKTTLSFPSQKLEFPPAPAHFVLVAPTQFQILPQTNFSAEVLTQEPPTPPPRSFFT